MSKKYWGFKKQGAGTKHLVDKFNRFSGETVFRCQILTSEVDSFGERIKQYIMALAQHRYSNEAESAKTL